VDDPESRKSLKPLDPPVKPGKNDITTLLTFHKDLFIIPIYNEKLYYSAYIPALKRGVFCCDFKNILGNVGGIKTGH
jgi:hypothetical protein